MTDPLDTQVVDWLAGLLGQISVANGYRTDAGQDVATERLDCLADDLFAPRLAVEDFDEAATDQVKGKRAAQLTLTLHALVPVHVDQARRQCRAVLADMRRALANVDRNRDDWPQGVTGISIGSRSVEQREDSAEIVSGAITATVKYIERYQGVES